MDQKSTSFVGLVACWVSGGYLIASGESIFRYGAFGGMIFASAILLAAVVLAALSPQGKPELPSSPAAIAFSAAAMSEPLILQAVAAGYVLSSFWGVSVLTALLLFIAINMLYAWFLRQDAPQWLVVCKVALLFIMAIFMPIYICLQKGLETVYHNLLHYKPSVLHLDQGGIFSFLLACSLALLGKTVQHRTCRSQAVWAAICWATTVMAFSTMAVVAKAERLPLKRGEESLLEAIAELSSLPVYLLFSVVLLLVLAIGYQQSLQLLVKSTGSWPWRQPSWQGGFLWLLLAGWQAVLCFGFVRTNQNLLDLLLWFGMLLGPYSVMVIFRSNAWLIPLLGGLAALPAAYFWGNQAGVIFSSAVTCAYLACVQLIGKWRKSKDCGKREDKSAQNVSNTLLQ